MICNRFDVVKVPFPFTDKDATKTRPALVISNSEFNRANNSTVFAMITSSTKTAWLHDTAIIDFKDAGLTIPCLVRMKLFTIDNGFILKRLGQLSGVDVGRFELNFSKLTSHNQK